MPADHLEALPPGASYGYNCRHPYHTDVYDKADVPAFSRTCGRKSCVFFKHGVAYSKKLFSPPYAFFEKLQFLLQNGQVDDLVFRNFAFTECFVEKWSEFLRDIPVETLVIHNSSVKHVSTTAFHRLLGSAIQAGKYSIERLRNCLPNHVSQGLLLTPGFSR